jgi:hypothetical protein
MINFTDLEKAISALFNNIEVKITYNGSGQPTIQHSDIMDQVGCFGNFISNVSLNFVGFRQLAHNPNKYWGTVFLNFETSGGFNPGILIASCWYNADTLEMEIELNIK